MLRFDGVDRVMSLAEDSMERGLTGVRRSLLLVPRIFESEETFEPMLLELNLDVLGGLRICHAVGGNEVRGVRLDVLR